MQFFFNSLNRFGTISFQWTNNLFKVDNKAMSMDLFLSRMIDFKQVLAHNLEQSLVFWSFVFEVESHLVFSRM